MNSLRSAPNRNAWGLGLLLLAGALATSCDADRATQSRPKPADPLPYLGERQVHPRPGGGLDTVVSRIPPFYLRDQLGQSVSQESLNGRVYVADFFFATCPSICPRMQGQLQRVYRRYQHNGRVQLLSHTIDPAHDSLPVLRAYAGRLGVSDGQQWHFVTAPRDTIFRLARAYATVAERDPAAPGSLVHGGSLALVDGRGYLRGLYDGLNTADTDRLLLDVGRLLAEETARKTPPAALVQLSPSEL